MDRIDNIKKELLGKLRRDLKRRKKIDLAQAIGIPAMTLIRITSGKSAGHIDTWSKIQRYYSQAS